MYNLMIAGQEKHWDLNMEHFWEKSRFLLYTDNDLKKDFAQFSPKTLDLLRNIPTLMMYKFHFSAYDGISTPSRMARIGRIVHIESSENGITVKMKLDQSVPSIDNLRIAQLWESLQIDVRRNENDRTHWAVKNVDLGRVLARAKLANLQPVNVNSKAVEESKQTTPEDFKSTDAPEVIRELRQMARTIPEQTGVKPKVFIVHGRDNGIKNEIARWISKIGMIDIVLHEQPSLGRSILTKFRDLARDVQFAIVIASPDDVGGLAGGPLTARARQNVIMELGFFIGVLGPERVVLIRCGQTMEIPSDYSGIIYSDYDERGAWKLDLVREFKEQGLSFDHSAVA